MPRRPDHAEAGIPSPAQPHAGTVIPPDATLLADLERQAHDLATVLVRLRRARDTLIPGRATFWRGAARAAFDAAIDALLRTVEAGISAVEAAHDHTLDAIRVVSWRA